MEIHFSGRQLLGHIHVGGSHPAGLAESRPGLSTTCIGNSFHSKALTPLPTDGMEMTAVLDHGSREQTASTPGSSFQSH